MTVNSDEDVPVTKYIVAREETISKLESTVSVLVDEGYMPVGGLCIYVKTYRTGGQNMRFAQAMWRQND